jgi:hypothetical protein
MYPKNSAKEIKYGGKSKMKLTSRNIILVIVGMAVVEIFAIIIFIIYMMGGGKNAFQSAGIQLNHTEIILYVVPFNLRADDQFLKAKLTYSRAKSIHQFLSKKPPSDYFEYAKTPGDIPLLNLINDKRWEPYKAKKYWIGSFNSKVDGDTYRYMYLFDISNIHNVYLYMYANYTFD